MRVGEHALADRGGRHERPEVAAARVDRLAAERAINDRPLRDSDEDIGPVRLVGQLDRLELS